MRTSQTEEGCQTLTSRSLSVLRTWIDRTVAQVAPTTISYVLAIYNCMTIAPDSPTHPSISKTVTI
jgi:hypothetical protein